MELSGKTALVTGALRGTGAAIGRRLAKAGAHVVINHAPDRDAAGPVVAEIAGTGGRAFAVQADVGTMAGTVAPGAVDTAFDSALIERPGWIESIEKLTSMGRVGVPEDIADAVMMLAREDAHWVTGQIVEASGGLFL